MIIFSNKTVLAGLALLAFLLVACAEERTATSEGVCSSSPSLGDSCDGGTVFSTDYLGAGDILIIQDSDYSTAITYRVSNVADTNATDADDGRNNTGTFDSDHYASYSCQTSTENSYSDWYLPALNELIELDTNISSVPSLTLTTYWSSTEAATTTRAEEYDFSGGGNGQTFKTTATVNIRCIRRPSSSPFVN